MQICWRRAAPREIDHELLWLSVSAAGLAAASAWLVMGLPWPNCMFLAITGHPCPTCGATRAAIQLFHGNFLVALRWNPLAFAFLCAVILFDVYAAVVLVTGAPRVRFQSLTSNEKNFTRILVVAMLTLNWIYLLITWRDL